MALKSAAYIPPLIIIYGEFYDYQSFTVKTQNGAESSSLTARAWNEKLGFFYTFSVLLDKAMNFYCRAFLSPSDGGLQTVL